MTFEDFFAANYKDVPGVDRNTAALLRLSARTLLALCWNAALEAALDLDERQVEKLPAYPGELVRHIHGLKVSK